MTWECQECKVDESGRPIAPGDNYHDKRYMQAVVDGNASFTMKVIRDLTRVSLKKMPLGWTMVPNSWDSRYHETYGRWFAITKEFTTRA